MTMPIANLDAARDTAIALKVISDAMRLDPDYAWTWHCNIACASIDHGMDPFRANLAASWFMAATFGVKSHEYDPKFRHKVGV